MKKQILAWCSSPTVASGFGRQASLILDCLYKTDKYNISIIGKDYHGERHQLPYRILPIFNPKEIEQVSGEFRSILKGNHTQCSGIDVVIEQLMTGLYDILFVYQDMYLTSPLGDKIALLKQELAKRGGKDFQIICYYTVDGKTYPEYLRLVQQADIVITPNQYGKDKIQKHVDKDVKIIPHGVESVFSELNPFDRIQFRNDYFNIFKDRFIVGYVGAAKNPRKNMMSALVGFKKLLKSKPDAILYIHSEVGVQILRAIEELDIVGNVVHIRGFKPRIGLSLADYKKLIASLDVLLNTSWSEAWGLPITEAMLSGVPVLMPENIAMSEEYKDFTWQIKTTEDKADFDSTGLYNVLNTDDIASKLLEISNLKDKQKTQEARKYAAANFKKEVICRMWSEAFKELDDMATTSFRAVDPSKAFLFAQYETAGDILLSTQCLKGLKEKHKGLELHYMTHPMYMDILRGNPYIDKLIPWNGNLLAAYPFVYKPHIDKIKNGNWGTGDLSLAELYPVICGVEPEDVSIQCEKPKDIELPEDYIVVHTTGGHPYRIYRYYDEVFEDIKMPIVQIGSKGDLAVKDAIDLKGKLSFRETAWVIAHARLFTGVDSFPHHCASALGTPQVAIFSCASPRATASPKTKGVVITPDWIRNCPFISPCHGNARCQRPCIDTIKYEDVKKAIVELLQEG